jgi:hypothetical protein
MSILHTLWDWRGSADTDSPSGRATYRVGDATYSLNFENFADAHSMARLLDLAHERGARKALQTIRSLQSKIRHNLLNMNRLCRPSVQ